MQHYVARQRVQDGRWDYCCGDRRVGYCDAMPTRDNPHGFPGWDQYVDECEKHADKFHTDGHETKEEAEACYLEYLLDMRRRDWDSSSSQQRCVECERWTAHLVQLGGYTLLTLCEEHATPEVIKKHYRVTESWES